MKQDLRYVWGGAALGAIFGAIAGWLLGHQFGRSSRGELHKDRLVRLLWSVVGVVRDVLDLG